MTALYEIISHTIIFLRKKCFSFSIFLFWCDFCFLSFLPNFLTEKQCMGKEKLMQNNMSNYFTLSNSTVYKWHIQKMGRETPDFIWNWNPSCLSHLRGGTRNPTPEALKEEQKTWDLGPLLYKRPMTYNPKWNLRSRTFIISGTWVQKQSSQPTQKSHY